MVIDLILAATVFGVIFAAELPDKTMFATLVLSTRFAPRLVWLGVTGAFLVHCLIAVVAGGLLSLAPERPVAAASALLFAAGAAILLLGRDDPGGRQPDGDVAIGGRGAPTTARAVTTSFAVLFVSEWGDLSQLTTAGFAARTGDPLSVFVGSVLALWTVAGVAAVSGRALARVVPLLLVRRLAGCAFAALAVAAAAQAVGG